MAVRFDAAADHYTINDTSPNVNAGFTFAAWIRITTNVVTHSTLCWVADGATTRLLIETSALQFNVYNGSGATGGSALSVGTWYHVAMTNIGGGSLLGYLNGVLDATQTGNTNTATTNDISLMSAEGFGEYTDGRMAAAKIWSAVLTADELQQEMRQYLPVRTANLWAFLPLHSTADGGTDYSGNGRSFTATGSLGTEDGPPIPWKAGRRRRVYVPSAAIGPAAGDLNLHLTEPIIGASSF